MKNFNYIILTFTLIFCSAVSYAGNDYLKYCPVPESIKTSWHGDNYQFIAYNHENKFFDSLWENQCHYCTWSFKPKQFNEPLSYYQKDTKKLACVYDIDLFDGPDKTYITTFSETLVNYDY